MIGREYMGPYHKAVNTAANDIPIQHKYDAKRGYMNIREQLPKCLQEEDKEKYEKRVRQHL